MRNWNITRWEGYGQDPDATKVPLTAENSEEDEKKNQTWTPIIYAVLGFSALIVIFGIIGILYLIRSRRRYVVLWKTFDAAFINNEFMHLSF